MTYKFKVDKNSPTFKAYNLSDLHLKDDLDIASLIKDGYSRKMVASIEKDVFESFKKVIFDTETDEEKVVRILKGDFEKKFGMTYEKFKNVYDIILRDNPEKLI